MNIIISYNKLKQLENILFARPGPLINPVKWSIKLWYKYKLATRPPPQQMENTTKTLAMSARNIIYQSNCNGLISP